MFDFIVRYVCWNTFLLKTTLYWYMSDRSVQSLLKLISSAQWDFEEAASVQWCKVSQEKDGGEAFQLQQ